mgnify:CR=1 FL=1
MGAAIGSVSCHIIACIINYSVLRKNIELDIKPIQSIIKPILATALMGICAIATLKGTQLLLGSSRIATLCAIVVAIIVYALSLILLKVFEREDYHMLPYGDKIYAFIKKIHLVKP